MNDKNSSSPDQHVIKTALELALEKLKSEPLPSVDSISENLVLDGRRAAAGFLRGEKIDWGKKLKAYSSRDRSFVFEGIREVFLLNIILPRTDIAHKECRRALEGLALIHGNDAALLQICAQVEQMCAEYMKQYKQLFKQLQQQFRQHAERLQEQTAAQTGMDVRITPEQLPDFQKQWQAQLGQLNDYYGQALDEIKLRMRGLPAPG